MSNITVDHDGVVQPNEQQPAPSSVVGARADRDATTGRFLRGNTAALVSGQRSQQFWRAADGERRATRGALLRQCGFSTDVDAPPALVAVIDGAAQAVLIRDACFGRVLDAGGPFTTHDRRRDVLRVWQEAADRALRHLQVIGLEPRQRDISLDDYLVSLDAGAPQDAHDGPQAAQDGASGDAGAGAADRRAGGQ